MDSLDSQGEEPESPVMEKETDSAQTDAAASYEAKVKNPDSTTTSAPPEIPALMTKTAPNGETLYLCYDCPYYSNFKRTVHRHIESVHMRLRSFKCPYCQYRANYMSNIKRHVSSVHDGVKKFPCPQCDYRTSDKGHLSSHIKAVHDKLKPFQCTECNYHASKRTDLNIHIKTVHEKEKPYKCPHCSYQASKSGNLKRHVKSIHEDPLPPKRTKRTLRSHASYEDPFVQAFITSQVVRSILDQVSQQDSVEEISASNPQTVLNLTSKRGDVSPSSRDTSPSSPDTSPSSHDIALSSPLDKFKLKSLAYVMANRDIEVSIVPKSQ